MIDTLAIFPMLPFSWEKWFYHQVTRVAVQIEYKTLLLSFFLCHCQYLLVLHLLNDLNLYPFHMCFIGEPTLSNSWCSEETCRIDICDRLLFVFSSACLFSQKACSGINLGASLHPHYPPQGFQCSETYRCTAAPASSYFWLPHSLVCLSHYISLFLCPHLFCTVFFFSSFSLTVCQTVLYFIR